MNRSILLLPAVLVLAGCGGPEPLSRDECMTLKAKEKAYIEFLDPDGDNPDISDVMNRASVNRHVEKCTFGTGYTREDFDCVAAAASQPATGQCLRAAWDRYDIGWDTKPVKEVDEDAVAEPPAPVEE